MARIVVDVSEAKAKLSKLIDMVYNGETVTIAIKASIGKLALDNDLLSLVDETGFEWIDLTAAEALLLQSLPFHHRDPFEKRDGET